MELIDKKSIFHINAIIITGVLIFITIDTKELESTNHMANIAGVAMPIIVIPFAISSILIILDKNYNQFDRARFWTLIGFGALIILMIFALGNNLFQK